MSNQVKFQWLKKYSNYKKFLEYCRLNSIRNSLDFDMFNKVYVLFVEKPEKNNISSENLKYVYEIYPEDDINLLFSEILIKITN